jgi:uncharacterized protein YaaN involved in tellurite resistance
MEILDIFISFFAVFSKEIRNVLEKIFRKETDNILRTTRLYQKISQKINLIYAKINEISSKLIKKIH